jgi:crotonobetainyl-CoA:carnitine CoA-transferase CaiB-like acyl-CoA transferase
MPGNPVWASDRRFKIFSGRKENEDELDVLMATWTLKFTAEEVMTLLQQAGILAAVVQGVEDLLENDPHIKQRQYFSS